MYFLPSAPIRIKLCEDKDLGFVSCSTMSQRFQGLSTLLPYSSRLALLLASKGPLPFQATMQVMFRGRNGASLLCVPLIVRQTSPEEPRLLSCCLSQDSHGIHMLLARPVDRL